MVLTGQQVVISEHLSATEAEHAALAHLRDGDELFIHDCYHRCHRLAWRPTALRPPAPANAH